MQSYGLHPIRIDRATSSNEKRALTIRWQNNL